MPSYNPPVRDMQFVLHEVLNVAEELKALPAHAETDADTINAVIEEAGKFAAEVTFPLNISGDEEGCVLDKATHEVKTPTGFKEAYAKYVEGGWPALSCDPAFGGQGLPFVVNQCLFEMLNSANQAWTMYPGLSHGAYEALVAHGTDEQKKTYLPKLVSGEWTGTMCLTEPHCGTDLGLLGRKVLGNNGASLKKFGKLVAKLVEEEGVNEKMAEFINPIAGLGDQLTKFTTEIGFKGFQNPDEVGAAAVDYLRVAGHFVFGYLFARMAQVALREIAAGNTDPFYVAKLQTARFYFAKLFPETATLMRTARAGSKVLMDTDAALA